jgi:hypothetical protein
LAHITEITGKYSELIARAALLANGWRVHTSDTEEPYDILATDPVSGDHVRIQVKTIRQRHDRKKADGTSDLVVYAKKGNGTAYDRADADYFVGIWSADGETPRVYMFENRLLTEYWASEAAAAQRWVELPIALDRTTFSEARTAFITEATVAA